MKLQIKLVLVLILIHSMAFAQVPSAPVATAATSITNSSFQVNWSSGGSVYCDVSTDNFVTFVGTYHDLHITQSGGARTVPSLSGGTTYQYRLRAQNASGWSAYSNVISVTTLPNTPSSITVSNLTASSFRVNWSLTTGADEYQVDVSGTSVFTTFDTYLPGSSSTYQDISTLAGTALSANTTYYFRVRAHNFVSGYSSYSSVTSVTTLRTPPTALPATSVTVNGSNSSFVVNWTSSGGGGVFLDVSSDFFVTYISPYHDDHLGGASGLTVSGLAAGSTVSYRLRVNSPAGYSDYSNVISAWFINPSLQAATSITQNSFVAQWYSVTNASSYLLTVSPNADLSSCIMCDVPVSGTSYPVSGLNPCNVYYYSIKAVQTGTGVVSAASTSPITVVTGPDQPNIAQTRNINSTSFLASWSSPSAYCNIVSWQLDVATDCNFTSFLSGYNAKSLTVTSQTVAGGVSGSTYHYRVRGITQSGAYTPYSDVVTVVLGNYTPLNLNGTNPHESSFQANWNPVNGSLGYILTVAGTSYVDYPVLGTSQVVSGLTASTTYYFKVASLQSFLGCSGLPDDGYSAYSGSLGVSTGAPGSRIGASSDSNQTKTTDQEGNGDNVSDNDWALYPNPVNDYAYLKLPSGTDESHIGLFVSDMTGKKIDVSHNFLDGKIQLNFKEIPSGIYILNATCPNKSVSKKIVKLNGH